MATESIGQILSRMDLPTTETQQRQEKPSSPSSAAVVTQQPNRQETILARYPTMLDFMKTIGPDRQTMVGSNPAGYICQYSPSLNELRSWYGKPMAQMWLIPQILEIVRFRGLKEGPTEHQYRKLSEIIVDTRGWLTVNEIQLFFYEMGLGRYEKFYGRFDPAVILSSFPPFIRHINEIKHDYEMKRKQR